MLQVKMSVFVRPSFYTLTACDCGMPQLSYRSFLQIKENYCIIRSNHKNEVSAARRGSTGDNVCGTYLPTVSPRRQQQDRVFA